MKIGAPSFVTAREKCTVGYYTGKRNYSNTNDFVADVAERIVGASKSQPIHIGLINPLFGGICWSGWPCCIHKNHPIP